MKPISWPRTVKSGPVSIKVYRTKHSKTRGGFVYTVAWRDTEGKRHLPQFTDPDEALAEAKDKADFIAGGRPEMAAFSRSDRDELFALRKIAGKIKPLIALQEWARAREIAGTHIVEAAEQWARAHALGKVSCTVDTLVDDFIAAKAAAKFDAENTYRRKLRPFAGAFTGREISSITEAELTVFLARHENATTRNDVRDRLVTLFRWARDKGKLPRGVQLEIELTDRARSGDAEIGIMRPGDWAKLLAIVRAQWPQDLAATVLAGFCAVRSDEIHGSREHPEKRQVWEDIFLDRGFLRVTAAKQGTPSWRYVPLCPAALAWLRLIPEEQRVGPVCEAKAVWRVRRTGQNAGLAMPKNCFRHSAISYRIPVEDGNKSKVATDAGTSVQKIDKRYRRPVTKEEGLEWFGVMPG